MDRVEDAYWSRPADALLLELRSSSSGLSDDDAAARLQNDGPNTIQETEASGPLRLLLRQVASPLVLILVFGAAVSFFLREWLDASIILAVVLGSTLLGFFQEYRASRAVAELRKRLALKVRALRRGRICELPVYDLVPGDVVQLAAGNLVPADGFILEATDFLVTESALTGESFPVEKRPGVVGDKASLAQRTNCVFAGTSVRSGKATVLLVRTGRATEFGAIAARLRAQVPETEFARGIRNFGYLLLSVMIVMVLFVLVVNLLAGRPTINSLLFAIALAVGLSPELLPAIVSVTLSAGAREMARRGVIVRRLEAIENLGSMDVLCTDKTGTLTEGVISLSGAVDCAGIASDAVRGAAFLNAAFETGIENPLDQAIVKDGRAQSLSTDGYKKTDEIPYDFSRKRLTIVVQDQRTTVPQIISKGAFDNILAVCTTMDEAGKTVPLNDDSRLALQAFYEKQGRDGFRVLGLATKEVGRKQHFDRHDETEMTFKGFLLFCDPPKATARQTIRDLADRGIAIKIVTGDNRHVATHVAEAIGLDAGAILTGDKLSALNNEALWHLADRTHVFAEIDPQQKELIVRALQRGGHAVGYLGDGINDAAALHAADVGISVDSAVDVARQSADIVLLRPDLDVLRMGVEDGRRTFANTLKYIGITTSANFGNMVSMALATPLLPFLPLAAKQILLNNFLSDIPSMAISTDSVDPDIVVRPQRWNVSEVRRFMIVFGLVSSAFDGFTFLVLLSVFHASELVFQTAWFVVSLLTELAVLLVLRTRGSMFRSKPSRTLLVASVAVSFLAVLFPYLPWMTRLFDFVPLGWSVMACLLAIVFGYVAATELLKRWFYARPVPAGH